MADELVTETYYCETASGQLEHRSYYHFPDLHNSPALMLLNTWRSDNSPEFHEWESWKLQSFKGYSEEKILIDVYGVQVPIISTLNRISGEWLQVERHDVKPDIRDEVLGTGQCERVDPASAPVPLPSVNEVLRSSFAGIY